MCGVIIMKTTKKSFKGWNLKAFLKGRKKLLIMAVGAIVGFIATKDPALAGLAGVGADFIYAVYDYYMKE